MKRLPLLVPLAVFLLIAGLLYRGLFLDPTNIPSALIGKHFPVFALSALDQPSHTLTRKDIVGRPALVNIWASWCSSCRQEHRVLTSLASRGVVIYGVNYKDERSAALHWLGKSDNPYLLDIEDSLGSLGVDLGVYGAPETFLIDAQGVIRDKYVGIIDEDVWRKKLAPVYSKLLQEAGP
ncbi:DsbE family thiol:disulfide interchange protein [Paraburkholderia terrae]|uniref:DsbE family thiol:disulfide interchange protein n=1 Tax=Paraburkholderia terrae TaxID=311230 RepID=UPI00200A494A|nr:DsbE family thiol:disulfide interchange protein [Paraburkholderia terrae]BDC45125.1 thiol:disulfide interchange protein DsbE [Paraburkholderia terrae]